MANEIDAGALRDIVGRIAQDIGRVTSHEKLDDALGQLGLPPSAAEGKNKAERVTSSLKAVPDDQLPNVARQVLASGHWRNSATRNEIQDLLWAAESHPSVAKRTRREVARTLGWDDLQYYHTRFRTLLENLFVLDDDDPFSNYGSTDRSVAGQIDQHVFRNADWTMEQLFDALGAVDASDRRFGLLLAGITSAETVPDEAAQRRLVEAMNSSLAPSGLEMREIGTADGYPIFDLVARRSRRGRPKNLIFASPTKPDLRLSDLLDSDIEILSNPDDVLVYDRPITADGLRWRDLQAWWKAVHQEDNDDRAKSQLYARLRHSLPEESPPQLLLFDLYHDIHGTAVHDLPVLLPEVWLFWDPVTVKARGAKALLNLRMDFLLLVPGGGRIVLEVDGRTHYATERSGVFVADTAKYARTMAGSRTLTLAGYEVYRFGADDLDSAEQARPILTRFFADLFQFHGIAPTGRK